MTDASSSPDSSSSSNSSGGHAAAAVAATASSSFSSSSLLLSSNEHYNLVIPPESTLKRIIHLKLSEDIVRQLQEQPDDVELSFDFSPSNGKYFLIVNGDSHELGSVPARPFSECYRQTEPSTLEYLGSVTHKMKMRASLDERKRMEIKKKGMIEVEQKHARKIEMMTDQGLEKSAKKHAKKDTAKVLSHTIAKEKSPAFLPPIAMKPRATTPIGRAVTPNASSPGQPVKKDEELRRRMIECLAVKAYTLTELVKKLHSNEAVTKTELSSIADYANGVYQLKHTCYKDVDPFKCRWYDNPTRRLVIQRATSAFHNLGLAQDAPEWRRLSPPPSSNQSPSQSSLVRIQDEEVGTPPSPGGLSDVNSSLSNNTGKGRKRENTPDSSTEQKRKAKKLKTTGAVVGNAKKKEMEKKTKKIFQGEIKNHSVNNDGAISTASGLGTPVETGIRSSTPPTCVVASYTPPKKSKLNISTTNTDSSSKSRSKKQDVKKLNPPKSLSPVNSLTLEKLQSLFETRYKAHEILYTEICNLAQNAQRMHEKLVTAGIFHSHKSNEGASSTTPPSAKTLSAHPELAREIDIQMAQFTIDGVRVTFNEDELRGLLSAAVKKYEILRVHVEELKNEIERRNGLS